VHNTRQLSCGRAIEKFPQIVTRLAGITERFCTTLDCVTTGYLPDGTLDQLPLPAHLGRTRIGGIDLDKPRARAVLAAVLALSAAPVGFTVGDLAAKVQQMTRPIGYTSARPPTTCASSAARTCWSSPAGHGATRSPRPPPAPSPPCSPSATRSSAPSWPGSAAPTGPQARPLDRRRPRLRDLAHRHAGPLRRPRHHHHYSCCDPPRSPSPLKICAPLASGAGPARSEPPWPNRPRSCCWPPRACPTPTSPARSAARARPPSCGGTATPRPAWTGSSTSPARAGPRPSAPTIGPRSWPPPSPHHPSTSKSPTGRPVCWATSSASATTPWPGCGPSTTSISGGPRPSSSQPTRSWKPRSATSSAGTLTRPSGPSWSARTKEPDPGACPHRPNLPLHPGSPQRRTHDDVRHETTTLFAALEVATGRVTDQCFPRYRHAKFLAFPKLVAKAYPRRQLQVVLDNYGTHTHPTVTAWLAKHPRVQLPFTPTSASWMNLVEGCLRSSPARRSGGVASPASGTWSVPSAASSTPGTSAATPLCGSRMPTTS
jgi:DDE superfamily endonuclease